jgi:hypothetical protein
MIGFLYSGSLQYLCYSLSSYSRGARTVSTPAKLIKNSSYWHLGTRTTYALFSRSNCKLSAWKKPFETEGGPAISLRAWPFLRELEAGMVIRGWAPQVLVLPVARGWNSNMCDPAKLPEGCPRGRAPATTSSSTCASSEVSSSRFACSAVSAATPRLTTSSSPTRSQHVGAAWRNRDDAAGVVGELSHVGLLFNYVMYQRCKGWWHFSKD